LNILERLRRLLLGHQQVVQLLLDRGANPAVEDSSGNTMLRGAQENGWKDLATQFFHFPGPSNK